MNRAPTLGGLVDALRRADLLRSAPSEDLTLDGISSDSRTTTPGTLFLAVPGTQLDGHRFIPDALSRGASALVVSEVPGDGYAVPAVVVRDVGRAAHVIAREWYHDPAARLRLVAVTGTNGKTTTTALVRHLLNRSHTAGSIGTLGAFDGQGAAVPSMAGTLTTPGAIDLHATLAELVARGVREVAMEASSHSLDQGRLDALRCEGVVFTNLTRDHLDYHGSMDAYLDAKLRLMTLRTADGIVAVNADDPAWAPLAGATGAVTYGIDREADVRAVDVRLHAGGSWFRCTGRFGEADVALPLPGAFNVANALAAAACVLGLGHPIAQVADRLSAAPQVGGRMERLAEHPCVVLRDYAHTPDALERALEALRPVTTGRLVVLFGCGGDRDPGKRPLMGAVADRLADLVYVTSDNPRTEDPDRIIADIVPALQRTPYHRITDRRSAIAAALSEVRADDTLLLAGKGHEDYQILGTTKVPFDEREIVRTLLGTEGTAA